MYRNDPLRRLRTLSLAVLTALVLPIAAAAQSAEFTPGQEPSAVVGQPDLNTITPALTAQGFEEPRGIATDTVRRKLYVADNVNNRVLRFDLDEAYDSNPTAEAVFGQPNMTTGTAASPSATSLSEPMGLAVDAEGNLWVADNGNERIVRFDDAATASSGAAAALVLGQSNFTAAQDNPVSATTIDNPQDVLIGTNGELWATDGSRVLYWANAATLANGAAATGVLGQASFTTDDSGPSATVAGGTLRGLAMTADGTLFVADSQAYRILRFNNAYNKSDGAAADAVLGQSDFTSGTSGLSQWYMDRPEWLEADSNGRLYVSDANNGRVLWFDDAATLANGAPASGVLGPTDFDTKAVEMLPKPSGLALDGDGKLWVANRDGNRVVAFVGSSDGTVDDGAPALCEQLPDMAVSPERIELAPGGTAQIEVALRNLCSDRPFSNADLLLSLNEQLQVTGVPAGWLNLGNRAAWQNLSLRPGETVRAVITVSAPNGVPAAPTHVTELYYQGRAQKRIDGVFITAAPAAPAPVVEAPVVPAAPAAPAPLPAVLPNTGGPLLPLGALGLAALGLTVLGAIRRRLR